MLQTNGCKLGDAMRCQSFAAKLVFLGSGYLLDAIGSLSSYGSQKFVMAASSFFGELAFLQLRMHLVEVSDIALVVVVNAGPLQ